MDCRKCAGEGIITETVACMDCGGQSCKWCNDTGVNTYQTFCPCKAGQDLRIEQTHRITTYGRRKDD